MTMNSISTKIKVAALVGLATLVSIALYVKADKMAEDASYDSSYSVYAGATTNLNAVMKAQPRANEYTSSEYMSKMAPDASQASEYLALYEYDSYQDNSGAYRRRTAPAMHQNEIKDGDPVPVKSVRRNKTTHWNDDSEFTYGIRSAVVSSDTLKEEDQPEDPRLQIETNVKRRIVSADGYSRDYSRVVRNAETNDDAYQLKDDMPYERKAVNEGYAVARAPQSNMASKNGEFARRKAPSGTNSGPVLDGRVENAKNAETSPSYKGYAVRTIAPTQTTSLSQYDNAKDNDRAYGGYAVRSANQNNVSSTSAGAPIDGYARRKAPVQGTNRTPVRDYADNTPKETYGGYAVRSGNQRSTNNATSKNLNTSVDGYARRKAPSMGGGSNIAQYENASKNDYAYKGSSSTSQDESYGGYAVKTPGKSQTKAPSPRREYAQSTSNESYGGYAVRNPGRSNNNQVASTTSTRRSTANVRGGVPASTGLKMYGSRGERLATNTSQLNRTVIVMPKRGRSIQGTVVQDDPGRNIIVQSTTGVQSTYRYGEIDAVVNL